MKFFRAAYRLVCALTLFVTAFLDFLVRIALMGKARSYPARAGWLKYWSGQLLQILHVEVSFEGQPPGEGILACNHLSYIDILVLGSIRPLVFVSKSEVASWPAVGRLTRCAGTLYIVRQNRADVVRLGEEMVEVMRAGVPVTLFLEGTSSDGSSVLPFRSSLLAPVETHHWPATAGWIHYSMPEGSVADEVCYWRDMTFATHFLNLLTKGRVDAFVSFGAPVRERLDRKEMARRLHEEVCGLRETRLGKEERGAVAA